MKKFTLLLALLSVVAFAYNKPIKASFNCDSASTPTEKAVCSDAELANLDVQLEKAYSIVFHTFGQGSNVKQKKWINGLSSCFSDVKCLKDAYKARIKELNAKRPKLSFDCANPNTPTKETVCLNSDLTGLDIKLNMIYLYVLCGFEENEIIKQDQRKWLNELSTCFSDVKCLKDAYKARTSELGAIARNVYCDW
ncbi:MAG: hypothetical protein FWC26_13420 [Fibromonadales bacterium]|nr:hypothetical protein [Fibromonadales bacterium]